MRKWLALVVLVAGCTSKHVSVTLAPAPPSAFSNSMLVDLGLENPESARDPRFVLIATSPTQARALLWDGNIGVSIGPYGTCNAVDGKGLPSFRADVYDTSEDIQALPSPLELSIQANGEPVQPSAASYWQTLDMRYGLLTTHWFAPVKGGMLEARQMTIVEGPAVLNRWEFHGPLGTKLTILRQSTSSKEQTEWNKGITVLVPALVPDRNSTKERTSGHEELRRDTVDMSTGYATWLSTSSHVTSFAGHFPDFQEPLKGFLLANHGRLASKSSPSIEIDGPLSDQQAINSFLYYLQTSITETGPVQISPFGLSSDRYNGHVFWDADVWVMPALAFIDPSILQRQADYRLTHMQPKPLAPFPWESSITGKETAPSDSKKEIHISGSVLWGLEFAKALGATFPDEVAKRVADYYLSRATKQPDGKLSLLDVMSPDESHIGPNDLYTNLVAQWAINGATWNPRAKPAATMELPQDSTSFLTYDGDQLRAYKQAAAVLSIFPLQYPPAEAEAKTMMERFQDKIIAHGPAMADSIHATIWARLGDADKGYDLWKKSWSEFVQSPFLLFSEKRTSPTTYFTTGAAGCLQSVIYGFLGFRVDEMPEPGAAWTKQLKNGRWLSIKPDLPSAWKSATFHNFRVLGSTYTLTVKREGAKTVTSVKQGD